MEKYNFVETIAFVIIAVLGIKLTASIYTHFAKGTASADFLESEHLDLLISIFTVAIFTLPSLKAYFFDFPKKCQPANSVVPTNRDKILASAKHS